MPTRRRRAMQVESEKQSRATGVALYALTLAWVSAVSGPARFAVGYVLFGLIGLLVGLPADPLTLALLVAAGPAVYSLAGVARPMRGVLWRRRRGAREPVGEELKLVERAVEELACGVEGELPEFECYVIDYAWPMAAARGRTMILSRGLICSEGLSAKLAHELFHLGTMDGRLTEGLHRMKLWGDPLRGGSKAVESSGLDAALEGPGGFVFGVARWLLRLAGGGDARSVINSPWSWYWRRREFAADAYAVALGQGPELLAYLEEFELPMDGPQPGVLRADFDHPYVIERVERLRLALGR
jgi:hypothetical protein